MAGDSTSTADGGKAYIIEYDGEEFECDILTKLFKSDSSEEKEYVQISTKNRKRPLCPSVPGSDAPRYYSCPECKYSTKRKCDLTAHLKMHAGEGHTCDVCGKTCITERNLMMHKLLHTGELPFQCTECDYKSAYKHAYIRHMRIHTGERPFACTDCDMSFADKGSLNAHTMKHLGIKPFACGQCEYKCRRKTELNMHIRACHTDNEKKVKRRQFNKDNFTCNECNVTMDTNALFVEHMRTHEERSFECTECNQRFASLTGYKLHILIHSNEGPFECKVCKYTTNVKQYLERHMAKHSSVSTEKYMCSICDYTSVHKRTLTSHIKNHAKLVNCPICQRMFSSEKTFEKHAKYYNNECKRIFPCWICNYKTSDTPSLKKHVEKLHCVFKDLEYYQELKRTIKGV